MANPHPETALVWLRRDLRCEDHRALSTALQSARRVWCVFVYDRTILDPLPRDDRRVAFIHAAVQSVDSTLRAWAQEEGLPGADRVGLIVRHGDPADEIPAVAQALGVHCVIASHDDEPAALHRDAVVEQRLARIGCAWRSVKDHVIFERSEVLTLSDKPFSVFTPYKNAWLKRLAAQPEALSPWPTRPHARHLAPLPPASSLRLGSPPLEALGFEDTTAQLRMPLGAEGAQTLLNDFLPRMDAYGTQRDFPAIKGPSYLSPHLRFGTLSVRQAAREARSRTEAGSAGAASWLSELIWRDFYHQILHHHPRVVQDAFKPEYDRIRWHTGPEADQAFDAWCAGQTGYPLVDAAMRQLNQTGWMHNRLRMVTSSFLIKDLGIDWRRGEAYFARQLLDFDLAANNGGWQWAASSGCDAQPYFRIFNPTSQSEKFDPKGAFIRRYVPELATLPDAALHAPWDARPMERMAAGIELGKHYPRPIVAHDEARAATLERYAVVKSKAVGAAT